MSADTTCAAMDDALAELALDLLAGDERAAVVAHIEHCARCRRRALELTAAADRLVTLAPAAEPPPGFEEKVLAAIAPPIAAGASVTAIPRRRRGLVVLAAVAAVLALVVGVGALVAVGRGGADASETAMVAPGGADVGDAYLHDSVPAWVVVLVPAWADRWGSQPYTVRVTTTDGTVTDLAGGDLKAGYGAWGTALPMPADAVHTVSLIGPDGRVWCTGTFA